LAFVAGTTLEVDFRPTKENDDGRSRRGIGGGGGWRRWQLSRFGNKGFTFLGNVSQHGRRRRRRRRLRRRRRALIKST
jgi:hypothetical protein